MEAHAIYQLIAPSIMAVCAFAFFALYHRDKTFVSARLLGTSYVVMAGAFTYSALHGLVDAAWPLPFIANAMFLMGPLLMVAAIALRFGTQIPLRALSAVALCVSGALFWFRYFNPDTSIRLYILTAGVVVAFLIATLRLLPKYRTFVSRTLATQLAFLSYGLLMAVYLTLDWDQAEIDGDVLRQSLYMAYVNMLVSVVSLTIAATLLGDYITTIASSMQLKIYTDPLTKLLNRRGFEGEAQSIMSEEGLTQAALIVLDVDHFKSVNDTYGHAVGDKALCHLTSIMKESVRPTDLVARIGGEEFCILLPTADERIGNMCAQSIRAAFEATSRSDLKLDETLTVSIGLTKWSHGESYAAAFDRADSALYEAKNQGRNRTVVKAPARMAGHVDAVA